MTFDRPSEEPFETNCDIRRGRKCQSSWSICGPDLAYWRYFVIIDENFIFHNGRTVTTTRLCFDRWDLVCSLIEHKQQYQTQLHRMVTDERWCHTIQSVQKELKIMPTYVDYLLSTWIAEFPLGCSRLLALEIGSVADSYQNIITFTFDTKKCVPIWFSVRCLLVLRKFQMGMR